MRKLIKAVMVTVVGFTLSWQAYGQPAQSPVLAQNQQPTTQPAAPAKADGKVNNANLKIKKGEIKYELLKESNLEKWWNEDDLVSNIYLKLWEIHIFARTENMDKEFQELKSNLNLTDVQVKILKDIDSLCVKMHQLEASYERTDRPPLWATPGTAEYQKANKEISKRKEVIKQKYQSKARELKEKILALRKTLKSKNSDFIKWIDNRRNKVIKESEKNEKK